MKQEKRNERATYEVREKEAIIVSAVPLVSFAWPGTGRHGDDLVSTVSLAHISPSPPLSGSEPPSCLGRWEW